MSMKAKKLVRILGNFLMVISLGYLVQQLYTYRNELGSALNSRVLAMMGASIVVCAVFVLLGAAFYRNIIRAISKQTLRYGFVGPLYAKSNLYKYLPGNVVHFIGRNQIAVDSNVSHPEVALSTAVEIGLSALGALLAALICSFGYVVDWLREYISWPMVLTIAATTVIVAGGLLLVLKNKSGKLWNRFKSLFAKDSLLTYAVTTGYYVLNQIANGMLFVILMHIMGVQIPNDYIMTVAGVYVFAWLAGFIIPGAPGGLGIREAMLTLLLGGIVQADIVVAAVLVNRIITVLGDLLAYPLTHLVCHVLERWNVGGVNGT